MIDKGEHNMIDKGEHNMIDDSNFVSSYTTEQEYWEEYDWIKTETVGMTYENYDLPF